jgi:hypothetical protein
MNPYKVWQLNQDKIEKIVIFNGDNEEDFSIFSDEEIDLVDNDNTIVSRSMIHADDSIFQVKQKILKELNCKYGDIYMFCYKTRKAPSIAMQTLDKPSLAQFMKNLDLDGINVNTCENIGFDTNCELSLKTPLGMECDDVLFSPNPFHNDLKKETKCRLTEHELLGNDIDCNNIYVCLAKDVLAYSSSSSVYFPYLNKDVDRGVDSDSLTIDELYRRHYNRDYETSTKPSIPYFHVEIDTKSGAGNMFKEIHATAQFPFIKHTAEFHRENLYRLYSVTSTKKGKRIPLLSKDKIMKLSKIEKRLTIYNLVYDLVITFDDSGIVTVEGEGEDIEMMIKTAVNPLLTKYCNYTFTSLKDAKKIRINYEYWIPDQRSKYVHALFGEKDFHFKRVDNYEAMDTFNTFLSDLYRKHGTERTIHELVSKHGFDKSNATSKVNEFIAKGRNAGLKTTIDEYGKITVYDLEKVDYIKSLTMYIDSIARGVAPSMKPERKKDLEDDFEIDDELFLEDDDDDCIGFSDDEEEEQEEEEEEEEDDEDSDSDAEDTLNSLYYKTHFFKIFKTVVSKLLENNENQDKIANLSHEANIVKLIQKVSKKAIVYSKISKHVLESMDMTSQALVQKDKQVIIPIEYSEFYPQKLAAEIIAGKRQENRRRQEVVEIDVDVDECLVLESLLQSKDYFEDMVPSETSLQIIPYEKNRFWHMFSKVNVLEFKSSFTPIIYILHQFNNVLYSIRTVKKMLWTAYLQYFEINKKKMIEMMQREHSIGDKFYNDELEELIKSESYSMTIIDLWVIAQAYGIPIVLFSSSGMLQNMSSRWVVLGYKKGLQDDFFFVEAPSMRLIDRTFNLEEMDPAFREEFTEKFETNTLSLDQQIR